MQAEAVVRAVVGPYSRRRRLNSRKHWSPDKLETNSDAMMAVSCDICEETHRLRRAQTPANGMRWREHPRWNSCFCCSGDMTTTTAHATTYLSGVYSPRGDRRKNC